MTPAPVSTRRAAAVAAVTAAAVVTLDQLTKAWIQSVFRLGEGRWLLGETLKFEYVRNSGVAFGMFADLAWKFRLPFFLLTLTAAGWLLWSLWSQASRLPAGRIAIGMIAGGAVGNLVDRMRYGEVVDFIDVWIGRFHWPTFNVADSGISVGTCLLLLALWRDGRSGAA